MSHYKLEKNNKKIKLNDKVNLKEGCNFIRKNKIIIYNDEIKEYVIKKKIEELFKQIIFLYRAYLETENESSGEEINLKKSYLEYLLFEKYITHLDKKSLNEYQKKYKQLNKKIIIKKMKDKQI